PTQGPRTAVGLLPGPVRRLRRAVLRGWGTGARSPESCCSSCLETGGVEPPRATVFRPPREAWILARNAGVALGTWWTRAIRCDHGRDDCGPGDRSWPVENPHRGCARNYSGKTGSSWPASWLPLVLAGAS